MVLDSRCDREKGLVVRLMNLEERIENKSLIEGTKNTVC